MHLKIVRIFWFSASILLLYSVVISNANLLNLKNAIGALRQGLRRTACDVLRNGQIYHAPCTGFEGNGYERPKGELVSKEVVYEEIDPRSGQPIRHSPQRHHQHRRPPHHRSGPFEEYRQNPTVFIEEEIITTPQAPVVKPRLRPPPPPPAVVEDDGYSRSRTIVSRPERDRPEVEQETKPQPKPLPHKPKPKPPPRRDVPANPRKRPTEDPCQINEGTEGVCMPASYCYAQHGGISDYRSNICEFDQDARFIELGKGICCPKEDIILDVFDLLIRVPHQSTPSAKIRHISLEEINNAAKQAYKFVDDAFNKEKRLIEHGMYQKQGSMQMMHQAFFGEFDPRQFQMTKGGFINTITTLIIMRTFNLSKEDARDGLYKYSIENTDLERFCIKEPTCVQSKYRSIDGSCNNLRRPLWAKSNTAFERLTPPLYADGLHQPRTRTVVDDKTMLPSARTVSAICARHSNSPDSAHTLMLMQWGQFLDHDLTLAASTRASTGQGLICCDGPRPVDHHACFPIKISENDEFYQKFDQKCMHFVRNAPAPRSDCSLGHREQMNTLTHIIDASMVYGSSPERAKSLRTFRDGKMKTSLVNETPFLPVERTNSSEDCSIAEHEKAKFKCFVAGDGRVNEQSGLTMLHNLLLREHNRIVDYFKQINPRWKDEILYQEARRIVAATIQHITYNEWLPVILGRRVMKLFNIQPKSFGFTKDYNSRTNPNILNEFATAAFRLHSLVQGTIVLMDENGQETKRLRLSDVFNNPRTLWEPQRFDQFLNGYTTEPAQSMDGFFTEELTKHLFRAPQTGFGMDLIALNIQRGRDHGLPGYNTYRKICGLSHARSFEELKGTLQEGVWKQFAQVYKHVDDIDLFIGASNEIPLEDGLVGPTLACILGEQFRRTKVGDRFWYENGGLPISFRPNQLAEIRKVSIASLICDNSDEIQTIQPLAFLRPGGWNKRISCSQIARMNLDAWKNEKLWS